MAKKLPSYINANGIQNLFRKILEPGMFKNYFKTATRNLSKKQIFHNLKCLWPGTGHVAQPAVGCHDGIHIPI